MPQSHVPYFFYPRVYRVTDVGFMDSGWGEPVGEGGWVTKPDCRPASLEKLESRHVYLIDNSEYLYLYIGNQVPDKFMQTVRDLIYSLLGIRLCELHRHEIQWSHLICPSRRFS
jgi:hypothetical protein